MKKLMIAAAAAAMVSGAFAVNQTQVYDYTATLKTTTCRAGKVSAKLLNYFEHGGTLPTLPSIQNGLWERGDEIGVRKQASVKIAGVIWGCDCPTISIPGWRATPGGYLAGYYFWNQQNREIYNPYFDAVNGRQFTTFNWTVLNRIDTMTKVEGSYILSCRQAGQRLFVFGAGFGTVKSTGCDTRVTSMSGNLAGFRVVPADEFGCVFCAATGCVVAPLCDLCVGDLAVSLTRPVTASAVSGTWKIKFNSKVAKSLSRTPWISRVYTFKKGGNAALHAEFRDRVWALARNLRYGADSEEEEADFECSDYFTEKTCEALEKYQAKYEDKDYYTDVTEDLKDAFEAALYGDSDDEDAAAFVAIASNAAFKDVVSDIRAWVVANEAEEDDDEGDGFDDIIDMIVAAISDAS